MYENLGKNKKPEAAPFAKVSRHARKDLRCTRRVNIFLKGPTPSLPIRWPAEGQE